MAPDYVSPFNSSKWITPYSSWEKKFIWIQRINGTYVIMKTIYIRYNLLSKNEKQYILSDLDRIKYSGKSSW